MDSPADSRASRSLPPNPSSIGGMSPTFVRGIWSDSFGFSGTGQLSKWILLTPDPSGSMLAGMQSRRVSKGSTALRRAVRRYGSIRRLAKHLGFENHTNVMRWVNGDRVPDGDSRVMLWVKLRIPIAWWSGVAAASSGRSVSGGMEEGVHV
jgi:hypothetical protein